MNTHLLAHYPSIIALTDSVSAVSVFCHHKNALNWPKINQLSVSTFSACSVFPRTGLNNVSYLGRREVEVCL